MALVGRRCAGGGPTSRIALFWHIPWPNPEVFRICPVAAGDARRACWPTTWWRSTSAAHAPQLPRHGRPTSSRPASTASASRSIAAADAPGSALPDRRRRATRSRRMADSAQAAERDRASARRSGSTADSIGARRRPARLHEGHPGAAGRSSGCSTKYPQWIGTFAFIQIGVPSRIELESIAIVSEHRARMAERINQRFPRRGGPTRRATRNATSTSASLVRATTAWPTCAR